MLLEMAVADAYAIPFEFVPHSADRPNDLKTFHRHPTYVELLTGQYTDDTQRSIGNAEVILGGEWWNQLTYAESYVHQFRLDPREGYSRGYQQLMQSVKTGMDFMLTIKRDKDSNGSVMGAAVVGFIKDPEMVKLAATTQACLTHVPATAIHAQLVALAANYMIYKRGSKDDLFDYLMSAVSDTSMSKTGWELWLGDCKNSQIKTTINAASISAFVVGALDRHTTLSGILREAVDRGGDTDSAAASAVAVASHCDEIDNDLPIELYQGLENGAYGADYLRMLDSELMEYVREQP